MDAPLCPEDVDTLDGAVRRTCDVWVCAAGAREMYKSTLTLFACTWVLRLSRWSSNHDKFS